MAEGKTGRVRKASEGSSEAKMELCAGLPNNLHDVVEHFERVVHPEWQDDYDDNFSAMDLDGLQTDCGRRGPHFNTNQTIWKYLTSLRAELGPDTILEGEDLSGLRRDQKGVLEAFSKISQQTSSIIKAHLTKAYLKDRIKLLTESCDFLSKFVWEQERRNFDSDLVKRNSDISETLKKIDAMEKEARKKSETARCLGVSARSWQRDGEQHRHD